MPSRDPISSDTLPAALRFLAGGGAATRMILDRDWSGHPLGAPAAWSEAFKATLSTVLNSPESMILCWGRDELSFFFNEAYFPLLGPRLAWAMGAPFREVWADGWAQAKPIIDDAFAGKSQHFTDLPWKLGADRGAADTWFSFSYSRVLDAAGEVAGLFILTNETTERVLADRALAESQAALGALNETLGQRVADATAALLLHQNIVQSNPGPILAFDRELRVTAFNRPHAEKFFETQGAPSYIGQRFPDYFIPEEQPQITALMERALAGETFTSRVQFGDPAHTKLYWDLTHGPLRDADGVIVGGFHHAVEVTGQVAAERALAESQEALRQAQKMEAVGQLTGGLAHDFNNLLTGIMGNLELLQLRLARGQIDDLDRFILAAQGAGRRAASLTQRLLAFSRRQTLDPKPTDVNRLIAGMEDMLRRTIGPANTLDVFGADDLWTANIDAGQLENAVLNLCINARDAMPDGGRLTIETANTSFDQQGAKQRDLPPGEYLSIRVSDTGTGMDAQTIERAFEPFFTTQPIGQGTGLGLSMIYGFARQSGGQVQIHSHPGKGATVCIYLPRHIGGALVEAQKPPRPDNEKARGGTVLIVDDEATILNLVEEVLNDIGYTVISAADGASGINLLKAAAPIDLLVTDVGLPNGMNGRQVADAARTLQPGLKVLFITGYAESAAVGDGLLEPGMELMTKPFTLDALLERVTHMLRRTQSLA